MTFWQSLIIALIGGSGTILSMRLLLSRLIILSLAHPAQTEALAKAILGLMNASAPASDAAITEPCSRKVPESG